MSTWLTAGGLGFLLTAVACARSEASHAEIRVAAASDLAGTLEELASSFERRTGTHVTIAFGASGLLEKQLEQGAPFDVFAAADASFADRAVRAGACNATSRAPYARGRLGLFTRDDAGVTPLATLEGLGDPRIRRIAIANPETAPYGRAARAALEKAKLWATLEPRIVYAENVRQALQMAESGNAEAALVAYSHAKKAKGGKALEVDLSLYPPLDQVLVACTHGKNPAGGADFAKMMLSEEARQVFARHGFLPPSKADP